MNTHHRTNSDAHIHDDILINRIIDGQANEDDLQAFQQRAEADPSLFHRLAQSQRDAAVVAQHVQQHLDTLGPATLPAPTASRAARRIGPLALSGWAAVVLLSVVWFAMELTRSPQQQDSAVPVHRDREEHRKPDSPEAQMQAYLQSPFVLGELEPIVLQVNEASDGSLIVRYVRRIEEQLQLDAAQSLPFDDHGNLTTDPATLRDPAQSTPRNDQLDS